jgi:hypothetical protein
MRLRLVNLLTVGCLILGLLPVHAATKPAGAGGLAACFEYRFSIALGPNLPPQLSSFFRLPPHTSRTLSGVLLQAPSGKRFFSAGHYDLAGHLELRKDVARMAEVQPEELRVLWAGELRVENRSSVEALGQVTAMNETSGNLFKLLQDPTPGASSSQALAHLSERFPTLFGHWTERIPYDEANKRLDPIAQRLDSNLRHDINNDINAIVIVFSLFADNPSRPRDYSTIRDHVVKAASAALYLQQRGYVQLTPEEAGLMNLARRATTYEDWKGVGIDKARHFPELLVEKVTTTMARLSDSTFAKLVTAALD